MKAALKKCRKLKMGGVPWSPKIQALIDKICAWNLLFRRRNGANINGRHLRNCFKQAKLDFSLLKCSRKTVIEQLDLAISTFRVAAKTADQTRADFRIDLAKAIEKREKKKGHKKANWRTILKQLKSRDRQKENARYVRKVNGKERSNCALTTVRAPDINGERNECTTKKEIEAACIAENKRRFYQASDSPFLDYPLFDKLGPLGLGPGADEILRTGTITLDEDDPPLGEHTIKLIRQLRKREDIPTLSLRDVAITTEKHIKSWSKAKEMTSSGDDGIHFGNAIAGITNNTIAEFEGMMRNVPFVAGFSPCRWRKAYNFQLFKKPGNNNVEALRTILLQCYECNDNNKILGRHVMSYAEEYDALANEQYGSRKHRSSDVQVTNRVLVLDIHRQM